MKESRKNLSDNELALSKLSFPPCELAFVPGAQGKQLRGRSIADGVLQIAWKAYQECFVYVFRAVDGPKELYEAAAVAQLAREGNLLPLVIAPYLSDEALQTLEELGISGLDLSGNGLVLDPPRLMMRATGLPRRTPPSHSERNVYQGVSSLVPRMFLTQPLFESPAALWKESRRRLIGAGVLLQSTISKALAQMEADLFITRSGTRGQIKLIRPASLLERIERSYVAPIVKARLIGKPKDDKQIRERLREHAETHDVKLVMSGLGSAVHHTAMAGPARLLAYVTRLAPFIDSDMILPTVAFPSIELIETRDARVYFDARDDGVTRWSSPVQTYLELASGGPREQATAMDLRTALLRPLESSS
jgi:hypothetical protein